MEVVCINNNFSSSFTIGKLYVVKSFWSDDKISWNLNNLIVIDDNGSERWYYKENFISVEEWREKQLEILLNEGSLCK